MKTLFTKILPSLIVAGSCLATTAAVFAETDDEQTDPAVAELIEQLGDDDYFVRERAQRKLVEMGFEAFEAVSAATESHDLEVKSRALYILRLINVDLIRAGDPPEVVSLLRGYEDLSEGDRLSRMGSLVRLPNQKGVDGLCRLVRFEKSDALSCRAALALIVAFGKDGPPDAQLAKIVKKGVEGSRRTGVKILVAWLLLADDPDKALAEWNSLIEREENRVKKSPEKTNAQIVSLMLRVQIGWLKKYDRKEDIIAAMVKLVEYEPGDEASLTALMQWLIDNDGLDAAERLYQRFGSIFGGNPFLMYLLAEARQKGGNEMLAEKAARAALEINPGPADTQLQMHFAMAFMLKRRGLFKWAEREYLHVASNAPVTNEFSMGARSSLAEMFHDQGDNLAAGEVMEKAVSDLEEAKQPVPPDVRSRMQYFYACDWKSKGDMDKYREFIDKSLEADATDADALIAAYKLYKEKNDENELPRIRKMITEASTKMRQEMVRDPNSPVAYNQYAWLIGNTEGNVDAALMFSKKSLQLQPDAGGYYDTLAHVYYAKGDYENAVKNQKKAVELDPHSKLLTGKLKLFEEALQKKQNETKKED